METISMQTMRELEVALGLKGTRKSLVEEYAVLYAEYKKTGRRKTLEIRVYSKEEFAKLRGST